MEPSDVDLVLSSEQKAGADANIRTQLEATLLGIGDNEDINLRVFG